MPVLLANKEDIPALVSLLNSAYRGDVSKKGWTTEADLLKGEHRTDETTLAGLFDQPDAAFLKYVNDDKEIEGCVFLHKKGTKLYLGMLSVSPWVQAKGIGKQLLAAADAYAMKINCTAIFMNVISVRDELVAWYERHGYKKTGKTEPFPADNHFGTPTQPLEFIVLEKAV